VVEDLITYKRNASELGRSHVWPSDYGHAGPRREGEEPKPAMNGHEKSHSAIVAVKRANKAGEPAAESGERRAGTEGNAGEQSTHRIQSRERVSQALERVRKAARLDKKAKFTALLHHVDVDLLRLSLLALKRDAAAGVDGVTWADYQADLEPGSSICTGGSIVERIGRSRPHGSISRRPTERSARWPSPPWKTR